MNPEIIIDYHPKERINDSIYIDEKELIKYEKDSNEIGKSWNSSKFKKKIHFKIVRIRIQKKIIISTNNFFTLINFSKKQNSFEWHFIILIIWKGKTL